ncbi:glycosyltransferase family 1 protein [Mycetocola tolaasinivorans]|uniref:Glycosyltransferase family 1 protein n=1 Tax=Mycetocola tolaasinivorans TaxID=76635 RepID=A0A3L7ABB9_9MICO|nr:glycosyltransferase family 1 protein [Mycetocola tolaasinivorans]RLP77527.1 glycosyltransferase family 1 protein [Mycetocola tolaasinivorans]
MKILFDARYIRTDFHDGISRYSASLAAALSELVSTDEGTSVTYLIHDPAQRDSLPAGAEALLIHAPTSWREPFTALLLNRHRADVLFSAMQTIGAAGRKFGLVLTLHDMIYYRHRTPPKNLAWPIRMGWRLFHLSYVPQRLTLNAADVVATVSETSKADFERVKLTRRPVVVIPNAPQPRGDKPAADISRAPRNLVYMGSFMPYKNVETLIRAMAGLPEHTLHLLSRITPERRTELEALIPAGARVIFHGGVSDEEYEAMLLNDAILVTASRDEGYGLPVAEALELGVPAVITGMDIFREVAGDGALYFDADSPAEVSARVLELDDDARRTALVEAGRAHITTFTWERSAQTLLTTLEAIHEHRSSR